VYWIFKLWLKNDRIISTLWHIDFLQFAFFKEIETDKADYNCISTTAYRRPHFCRVGCSYSLGHRCLMGVLAMWIFMNDSFLSIVVDIGNVDSLPVRARIRGDIERVFPEAQVIHTPDFDYYHRASLPGEAVAARIKKTWRISITLISKTVSGKATDMTRISKCGMSCGGPEIDKGCPVRYDAHAGR